MPFLGFLFLLDWVASGVYLIFVFVRWIRRRRKVKAAKQAALKEFLQQYDSSANVQAELAPVPPKE